MTELISFGAWMQRRRKLLDLTRKALAERVGCSPTTINKIERDERKPSVEIAELLAVHLQIPEAEREAFVQRARGTYLVDFDTPTAMGVTPEPVAATVAEAKASVSHNLPTQPTPFLGRTPEIKTLSDYLAAPDKRLVTILGAGGMGKTRLALAVAEQQITNNQFTNGVFFVPLAPLSEAEQIVPALADALDFPLETGGEQRRTAKQQVLDYLRQKSMLLIFDNFEHLLGGVELVAEVLQTAVSIKIIATSRERLQLQQEQLFTLHGLDAPASEQEPDMGDFTAVQLFLQSAQRARHDFQLTEADYPALVRLCHLVGGLPLAVELAASWVEMLSLAEIVTELQQSLDFLETAVRNIPARQRSIRAVFDGSWRQLSQAEQAILPQFAIFRGGFTRKAAQTITGASLPTLSKLVNKSLLQYDAPRQRYQIHELLRQYLAERLGEDGERETAVRTAHSTYYLNALAEREAKLKGREQQTALAEIEADIENVRVAWRWSVEQGDIEGLAGAMDALGLFFEWNGRFEDGAFLFQTLLEAPHMTMPDANPLILARTFGWASVFQRVVANHEIAFRLLERGLAIVDEMPETVDSQAEKGFLLLQKGQLIVTQGTAEDARECFDQSLLIYQELKDSWAMAEALYGLGKAANKNGYHKLSSKHSQKSLQLYRLLGYQRGIGRSLESLSSILRQQGNLTESMAMAYESLTIYEKLNMPPDLASGLSNLGMVIGWDGDLHRAETLFLKSIDLYKIMGDRDNLASTFCRLGITYHSLGNLQKSSHYLRQGLILAREIDSHDHTAFALWHLGITSILMQAYDEARDYLLESILYYERGNQLADVGRVCSFLATSYLGLGMRSLAKTNLLKAVKIGVDVSDAMATWQALANIATILAEEDNSELALFLHGLCTQFRLYQVTAHFKLLQEPLKALADTLHPETAQAIVKRGQNADLWQTAVSLRDELTELGWGDNA